MAIPATLLIRALLLEIDPDAIWARWLTGDQAEPPDRSPESVVTRPDEALEPVTPSAPERPGRGAEDPTGA